MADVQFQTCKKLDEVSHEKLVLVFQGHFCVLRGRRSTLEACHQARRFFVAGTALCDVAKLLFCESHCQGSANMTQMRHGQRSWQGQHLVTVLKSGGSVVRFILFELCKMSLKKLTKSSTTL